MLLSEGDPIRERELRKMDMFSFLNRILALRKNQKANERLNTEPFGNKFE